MSDKRVSTGEAARRMGVSGQWVRSLIADGRLQAERTPLGYLVDEESVAEYLRSRTAKAAA